MFEINASIACHKNRIWCAYRTTDLYAYDSISFLTELDSKFEPISATRLLPENGNTAFEDVRLFSFGEKLLAFYTYLPLSQNGWRWIYGIGYGVVDIQSGLIREQKSLRHLSKRTQEKNWTPYEYNGTLFMITDFEPFLRVIMIGKTTCEPKMEVFLSTKRTKGWEFGELRGGTPLIPHPDKDDGWLYGFIHSYRPNENGFNRYYYYTVVRFNHSTKDFQYYPDPLPHEEDVKDNVYETLWERSNSKTIKAIFPMGIMYHEDGVIVSFGKDDVISQMEYFSWEFILQMF